MPGSSLDHRSWRVYAIALLLYFALGRNPAWSQPAGGAPGPGAIRVIELQGAVEFLHAGGKGWAPAAVGQVLHPLDHLRSGVNSRVALLWPDQSVVPLGASTEIEVLPPPSPDMDYGLHLIRGIVSFFHRDRPGRIQIITRGAIAGVEGTEFVMTADDTDATALAVIDGAVNFGTPQFTLSLTNGQQGIVKLGKVPVRTNGFVANDLLEWCFYYPAVLDLNDLPLSPRETHELSTSLDAYRAGDLPAALARFPVADGPSSDAVKIYQATLLLSVGEVESAEATLAALTDTSERIQRLAFALHRLIAAVKRQPYPYTFQPRLATEFLADSYYEQSRGVREVSLEQALGLAQTAVTNSPQFGFALERVAELEFSFGETPKALAALNQSLAVAPLNPDALALKGFLLAAHNQTRDAITWFDRALAVNASLGNAWLGRGLCRIHLGDDRGGREDLLVAAALEPQRAKLRSYLGKAFSDAGDFPHAIRELQLAKKLNPNDPTAWLYSALLDQDQNQINAAVRDLEKAQALNGGQTVYRSQLLLDQDNAVRSANLATIYRQAGMPDISVQEASRAVNYDYANYSAHLFLANSYYNLRDPNEINLRYETAAESEFLLANLLAPVGAGTLSPIISQGEYSRLFQQDGFGVVSDSQYLSRGAWSESGAQFGTFGNFSYDFESFYRSDPGQQVNNDVEQRQLSLTTKYQLTPQDSFYLNASDYQTGSGDLNQYYSPSMANPEVRENETQEPIVDLGYHHEWSPGVHTLLYLTRLNDTASLTNPIEPTLVAFLPEVSPPNNELTSVQGITMRENYWDRLNIYSGELQQIWQQAEHNTIVGSRFQYGHFDTAILQNYPSDLASLFPSPPAPAAQQSASVLFRRLSFYGYHQWQILDPLQLIGGVTYDQMTYPENFRLAPISSQDATIHQFSPKAGLIWTPNEKTTVRFAYTRSLGGASLDQSYQLEPPQVAGFIQSYRSIIPESIVGGNAGAKFETFNLALEQKFPTGTYLGLSGELLDSTIDRVSGAFDDFPPVSTYAVPAGLNENLKYQEKTLLFTANQLLGDTWSLGLRYRLSKATLDDTFPGVPDDLIFNNFQPQQTTEGLLQQLDLTAINNLPSGFFSEAEALWNDQSNAGYSPGEPGDTFWQFNAFVGYRSPRQRVEISVGLLNINNQNYNLNPLNFYNELPHARTLMVTFKLDF